MALLRVRCIWKTETETRIKLVIYLRDDTDNDGLVWVSCYQMYPFNKFSQTFRHVRHQSLVAAVRRAHRLLDELTVEALARA